MTRAFFTEEAVHLRQQALADKCQDIVDPSGHLNRDLPPCTEADAFCQRQVELARVTGAWVLATFLECKSLSGADRHVAFQLLPDLQQAWHDLPAENTLGSEVQAIGSAPSRCLAVEESLRRWGRPG